MYHLFAWSSEYEGEVGLEGYRGSYDSYYDAYKAYKQGCTEPLDENDEDSKVYHHDYVGGELAIIDEGGKLKRFAAIAQRILRNPANRITEYGLQFVDESDGFQPFEGNVEQYTLPVVELVNKAITACQAAGCNLAAVEHEHDDDGSYGIALTYQYGNRRNRCYYVEQYLIDGDVDKRIANDIRNLKMTPEQIEALPRATGMVW